MGGPCALGVSLIECRPWSLYNELVSSLQRSPFLGMPAFMLSGCVLTFDRSRLNTMFRLMSWIPTSRGILTRVEAPSLFAMGVSRAMLYRAAQSPRGLPDPTTALVKYSVTPWTVWRIVTTAPSVLYASAASLLTQCPLPLTHLPLPLTHCPFLLTHRPLPLTHCHRNLYYTEEAYICNHNLRYLLL